MQNLLKHCTIIVYLPAKDCLMKLILFAEVTVKLMQTREDCNVTMTVTNQVSFLYALDNLVKIRVLFFYLNINISLLIDQKREHRIKTSDICKNFSYL